MARSTTWWVFVVGLTGVALLALTLAPASASQPVAAALPAPAAPVPVVLASSEASSEAAAGEEAEPKGGLMDVRVSQILWTWVVFLVLLAILAKFAWRPLQKALDARATKIEADLAEAKHLREAAEASLRELEVRLDHERQEAEAIREEARQQGEALRAQLEAEANAAVAAVRERTSRELELQAQKVREDLRDEAVRLALVAAEKVIEQALSGPDHERLARATIDAIAVR